MLRSVARRAIPVLLLALAGASFAQSGTAAWPTKPLRLLIGFPPGSVQDLSARAIAIPLARTLGQMVVVENRSGASGTIAADLIAKSSDQHTLGVMNNSQLTIARMLNPAVAYDPAKDLAPIALIGTTPMVLVVSASAPGDTPAEWLAWLRAQGHKAFYGSPGLGTPGHLGMELLKSRGGIGAEHVPYPGNPQIITAMLGGQLQAALLPPGLAMQQVRTGKMKAIGLTSSSRSALAPGLVPLAELGIQDAQVELWSAMAGPATLPKAIRDKLGATLVDILKGEEARQNLLNVGWQPTPTTAEGLRRRMQDDTKAFGDIITLQRIRSDS